uniref:Small ribosomal subunit protein bS16m n=1 Tax=Phallusia mammillata TaxID=59560 RepID=A0A6F9DM47_9ASCI|nr:28S ribosomal protein S16, mitochondrial-like [Phallusia mammillata]
MVRLSWLLLERVRNFRKLQTTRERLVARNAECLFAGDENIQVYSKLDGVPRLKNQYAIRLAKHGCPNRPFYHIVLAKTYDDRDTEIEQLGTYDPMPNINNEKLCALNFERIKYHIALGAYLTRPIRRLLGLSGFLPLDPTLLIFAENLRRRKAIEQKIKSKESEDSEEKTETEKEVD